MQCEFNVVSFQFCLTVLPHSPLSSLDPLVAETSLSRLNQQQLMLSFQTNAIGPMLVCHALAPLLVASATKGAATESAPAVIANVSARVSAAGGDQLLMMV
jgi:NAD(P)-dependent dehydrogenase (short-subunit alcohol dehydrogenase family)